MKSGFEHSQAVATDLEKSVGQKPFVGFNWRNGSLTNINVTFNGIPKNKSPADIYEPARQAITSQFKQQPQQIIISFAIAS